MVVVLAKAAVGCVVSTGSPAVVVEAAFVSGSAGFCSQTVVKSLVNWYVHPSVAHVSFVCFSLVTIHEHEQELQHILSSLAFARQ